MSGFEIHKEAEGAYRRHGPLGNAETFARVDPIQLVAEQVSDCLDDGNPLLAGAFIGFAFEPATGIHASSRTGAANGFGAAENDDRTYLPGKAPGLEIRTRNYWTTAGTQIAKDGNTIGEIHQISGETGTNVWGVESTAATPGTHVVAFVTEVLDNDGKAVDADTTLPVGEGWVVFRITGDTQEELGGA